MSSSEGQKCSSLVGLSQWSCISLIGNQRRWLRKLWSCCYYTWQATKATLINIGYQSQYHTISNQSCKWSSTTRTHEEPSTQGPKCSSSIDPSEWSCKSLNGNQRWHEKPWSCCYFYMRSHEGHSNQQGISILMSNYFQSKVANSVVLQGLMRSLQLKVRSVHHWSTHLANSWMATKDEGGMGNLEVAATSTRQATKATAINMAYPSQWPSNSNRSRQMV